MSSTDTEDRDYLLSSTKDLMMLLEALWESTARVLQQGDQDHAQFLEHVVIPALREASRIVHRLRNPDASISVMEAVDSWRGTPEGQQMDTDEWYAGIPQADPDKWRNNR